MVTFRHKNHLVLVGKDYVLAEKAFDDTILKRSDIPLKKQPVLSFVDLEQ